MRKISLLISMLLFSGSVFAVDGVSVVHGNGDSADMARAGAVWNWGKQWLIDGDWLVTGLWEASLGSWRGRSAAGNNQTVTDVGIIPVFRLQQKNPGEFAPYAEAAIGFHLITPTFIYADRQFGTTFQISDSLGVGIRFGGRQQFELGYRFQHLSNGGIKKPNHGINFNQVRIAYYF